MKNRFDLIIFDWDGTLVDSIDWIVHCIQSAAIAHNVAAPDKQAVKDIIGLSIVRAMDTLFPGIDEPTRQAMAAHYSQLFFSKQISRDDLFDGVYEMLVEFKKAGFLLAVATGKTASGLSKAIAGTEVAHLFDATRCADQTASKPHPLMLEELVATLEVSKARTLMVGDSIHDLEMAQNAGIASIAVTCGAHSVEVLQPFKPLMCLSQTAQLAGVLN